MYHILYIVITILIIIITYLSHYCKYMITYYSHCYNNMILKHAFMKAIIMIFVDVIMARVVSDVFVNIQRLDNIPQVFS